MGEKGTEHTKSHSLLQGILPIIIYKSSIFVFYATLEWTKESVCFPPSEEEEKKTSDLQAVTATTTLKGINESASDHHTGHYIRYTVN
jgi:hypothetical protein